jgi:hypothetical protein
VCGVVRRVRTDVTRDESGQLSVMIIGFTVLCLLVATTVMAVSAVHIEHKKLLSTADGAAAAAADSFRLADTASSEGPPAAVLAPERVRGVVTSFLERDGAAGRFEGLSVASATGTADGRTATVSLRATARVPAVNFVLPQGVPIEATANARARLTR